MRKQSSVLPTTVVDQIRLWEQEGQRVKHQEGSSFPPPLLSSLLLPFYSLTPHRLLVRSGYLYDDFSSSSDYALVLNYAKELDVLLWETEGGRKLFVTAEGHALVRLVFFFGLGCFFCEIGREDLIY